MIILSFGNIDFSIGCLRKQDPYQGMICTIFLFYLVNYIEIRYWPFLVTQDDHIVVILLFGLSPDQSQYFTSQLWLLLLLECHMFNLSLNIFTTNGHKHFSKYVSNSRIPNDAPLQRQMWSKIKQNLKIAQQWKVCAKFSP